MVSGSKQHVANTPKTIFIEPLAPRKPTLGQPCNGCGVCCLSQPCPIGMLLSGRRTGACSALHWSSDEGIYRCGALTQPKATLQQVLPVALHPLASVLAPVLARVATRAIAAGIGCDSSLDAAYPPTGPD